LGARKSTSLRLRFPDAEVTHSAGLSGNQTHMMHVNSTNLTSE